MQKSIFSNMTFSDPDLEGTSPKVAKWVPLSKSNIHAKFGMDRASSLNWSNYLAGKL